MYKILNDSYITPSPPNFVCTGITTMAAFQGMHVSPISSWSYDKKKKDYLEGHKNKQLLLHDSFWL